MKNYPIPQCELAGGVEPVAAFDRLHQSCLHRNTDISDGRDVLLSVINVQSYLSDSYILTGILLIRIFI